MEEDKELRKADIMRRIFLVVAIILIALASWSSLRPQKEIDYKNPGWQLPQSAAEAINREWPHAVIKSVKRESNLPCWEPDEVFNVKLQDVENHKERWAVVTESGLTERVTEAWSGEDAEAVPEIIRNVVARAVPGGVIIMAKRVENRASKGMTRLAKPATAYFIEARGADCIVGLTVNDDNKEVVTSWKTPPAIFKSLIREFPTNDCVVIPKSRFGLPEGEFYWQAAGGGINGEYVEMLLDNNGGKVSAEGWIKRLDKQPEMPQAVHEAVATEVSKDLMESSFVQRVEQWQDENNFCLSQPRTFYRVTTILTLFDEAVSDEQIFKGYTERYVIRVLAESGELTRVSKKQSALSEDTLLKDLPAAVFETAKSRFPGWRIYSVMSWNQYSKTYMNDSGRPQGYHLTLARGLHDHSVTTATVTEDGLLISVDLSFKKGELPQNILSAVGSFLPGGDIDRSTGAEEYCDKNGQRLNKPMIKYHVPVALGDRQYYLILDENGEITSKFFEPAWTVHMTRN